MKKYLFYFSLFIFILPFVGSCGGDRLTNTSTEVSRETPAPWDLVEEGEDPPVSNHTYDTSLIAEQTDTGALPSESQNLQSESDSLLDIPPIDMSRYHGVNNPAELFNDSNKYQYAAGEKIGITPITGLAEAYFTRRPLVKIKSNRYYTVEKLTHSIPYLVPEAANLLETIGRNFEDSLRSKKLGGYKICVTSLLRSAHSVKKLRRVNRNATDSSTHQLGTTFDISYNHFEHDGRSPRRGENELKLVLSEVLRDLRANQKCMVKYEIKSPCFHITATGR